MTHPGSLGGFPGDWNFQGDAIFVVGEYHKKISVSLYLTFSEGAEINIKLIWEGVSQEERFDIADQMYKFRYQMLIIQKSVILIGVSSPPLNISNEFTSFNATRLITYSSFPQDIDPHEHSNHFVQLRAYLNDDYSLDDSWGTEFENIPERRQKYFSAEEGRRRFEENLSLYCTLMSGYEIKCGKKYVTHKDHGVLRRRNIETLYHLSFLDVSIPFNACFIQDKNLFDEVSLFQHLENTLNDACAFLSIVCDYEILPIYYDYSIYSRNKYVYGRVIPIWSRRKISRISKSWPTQGINLFHNVASFFECCPIDRKLSRGIRHLQLTVCEATVELKLMAACSSIEYFYSYWFWNMQGLSKLIEAIKTKNTLVFLKNKNNKDVKDLENLQNNKDGKTPYLSTVIRFFLNSIGIDWKKYIDATGTPHFIKIRNELLHGSFTSDDTVLFIAEDCAQKVSAEILFKIMKIISKSNVLESYDKLPVRSPEQDFYNISEGWEELSNAFDELCSDSDTGIFWA